jgi:hypothetical protein
MGDRYFVRSFEDAPEKGPYDLEQLQKSYDKGLLKPEAKARVDGGEKWIPLKELFAPVVDRREKKKKRDDDDDDFERARDMERRIENERRAGQQNVWLGVAMIGAGVLLTVISISAGGGRGAIFIGLVVFGLVVFGLIRVVRGAATR